MLNINRVSGLGFRDSGSGFRVSGFRGFRVLEFVVCCDIAQKL